MHSKHICSMCSRHVALSMLALRSKPCCVLIWPLWAASTAVECCGALCFYNLLLTDWLLLPLYFFHPFIRTKLRRWESNNNWLWCHDRRSVLFLFSSSPGEATVSEVYIAEHDCFWKAAQHLQTSGKQYITVRSFSCLQIKVLSVSVFKSVFMDGRIPAAFYMGMNTRRDTLWIKTWRRQNEVRYKSSSLASATRGIQSNVPLIKKNSDD